MTVAELLDWQEFEEDFGPMTVHERIDAAAQMIAYTVHASAGGEASPDKFRLQWGGGHTTPENFFRWLGVVATRAE